MKVIHIVGARPQFIKAAALLRALSALSGTRSLLAHTGQHYDANMSAVFFQELEIPPPDYELGIGSGAHGAQTGRMLEGIERVLLAHEPDWVVVYGDTNSTLAGALAAVKLHFPVAHVEAGLRSFNRRMPEEINRILTDHASDLLLAPTRAAVHNLRREGFPEKSIHRVGDVMYDAALYYGTRSEQESRILEELALAPKSYILATVHRAENTDGAGPLREIFAGLAEAGKTIPVVLPLHPRTRAALERVDLLREYRQQIRIVEPLGYLDMIRLEKSARLVVTDSGGVQKEAFFFRTPCVTVRTETEWVELVEMGWNRLVPPASAAAVAEGVLGALDMKGGEGEPYGDGSACESIVRLLARGLECGS